MNRYQVLGLLLGIASLLFGLVGALQNNSTSGTKVAVGATGFVFGVMIYALARYKNRRRPFNWEGHGSNTGTWRART